MPLRLGQKGGRVLHSQAYREAVKFVESFSNQTFRKNYRKNYGPDKTDPSFFIERAQHFMDVLGHPERGFKYVHVTGTAGKGTISTTLQNVLTESGRKTGLFTSPYSTTAIEEIRVGDLYIAQAEFVSIVRFLKPFITKTANGPFGPPSTFEIFLAIALIYFRRQKCEWVVLEVGLGGTYDATNVITRPVVTAITNIDYDHTEILGKTLGEIAADKAGIIKKGSAFFTSEQRPELLKFFKKVCKERGAGFHFVGKGQSYLNRNRLLVQRIGEHLKTPQKAIDAGMKKTRLPCRFEIIKKEPLVILDGAHNRAKIASVMANLKALDYERLIVVVGISNLKKDNRAILVPLARRADQMILTSFGEGERMGVHPQAMLPLVIKFKKKATKVSAVADPFEALDVAIEAAKPDDCILVTGSFFLAGKLRTRWYPEEWVLRNRRSFK